MKYWETWKRRREKKYRVLYKRGPSTLALIFAGMALTLWGIFALLSSYPVGLYLYYTVVPKTSELLGKALTETSQKMVAVASPRPVVAEPPVVPVFTRDITLPEGHYLMIPKIGVDTVIWEGEGDNYEKALKKGVWRVMEFGKPDSVEEGRPIILAAHRFGYIEWTQDYREQNAFYNLPKLEEGDQIGIVWNQHRYMYRVTQVTEATEIADYSSELIMYTCKFMISPIRIIVYADLVE